MEAVIEVIYILCPKYWDNTCIRQMGTLSGEATLPFSFLPTVSFACYMLEKQLCHFHFFLLCRLHVTCRPFCPNIWNKSNILVLTQNEPVVFKISFTVLAWQTTSTGKKKVPQKAYSG